MILIPCVCVFPFTVKASPDWTKWQEFRSAMVYCGNIYVSCVFVSASKTIIERIFKWVTVQKIVNIEPSKATSLLTKLGRCPGSAQRQYCRTDTTLRGASFFPPIFLILSNQHWLRSWHNRWEDLFNVMVVTPMPIWALLVAAFCWNLLVRKPRLHIKVGFTEGLILVKLLAF